MDRDKQEKITRQNPPRSKDDTPDWPVSANRNGDGRTKNSKIRRTPPLPPRRKDRYPRLASESQSKRRHRMGDERIKQHHAPQLTLFPKSRATSSPSESVRSIPVAILQRAASMTNALTCACLLLDGAFPRQGRGARKDD